MRFNKEPAVILALVSSALILAVGFGLKISGEQINNIMLFSSALITFFGGVVIRQNVVSPHTANEQIQIGINSPKNTTVSEVIEAQKEGQNVA